MIRFVQIDGDERAAALMDRGWDVLDAHRRERENDRDQEFHSGPGRARELQHDAQLFRAYLEVERRLRDEGAKIERVVLERDLRRKYQEFLQEHNRHRPDSDGRPDREAREIVAHIDLGFLNLDTGCTFRQFRGFKRELRDESCRQSLEIAGANRLSICTLNRRLHPFALPPMLRKVERCSGC